MRAGDRAAGFVFPAAAAGKERQARRLRKAGAMLVTLLWILAVIVGIVGVLRIIRGDVLVGILLIVLAFLIGPGGVSFFG